MDCFEHPEDARLAQAGENPAFYHLPWIRFFVRLLAACCFPHWHPILDVDSRRRLIQADPWASVRMASFAGLLLIGSSDIKVVSGSTGRIILQNARINLFPLIVLLVVRISKKTGNE